MLGYGRAAALGLAVFLAGWALGAGFAARLQARARASLLIVGVALALAGPSATALMLWLGRRAPAETASGAVALASIAVVAGLQGLFLPLLARRLSASVGVLLCANWAGAAVGAFVLADRAVGVFGRPLAAVSCGACALAAAWIAAPFAERDPPAAASPSDPPALSMRRAAWIVGCATASMAALQWTGLRLGVLWLGGMQPALRAILCASLVALGAGAALGALRRTPRARDLAWLLAVCAAATLWPAIHPTVARAIVDDDAPRFASALLLVAPMLAPFGVVIPWLHRATGSASDGGARLARLLVHEAWGALIGIPLVQWWIVPRFGLSGACAAAALFAACGSLALVARARTAALVAVAAALGIAAWNLSQDSPALRTPPLANPALALREFAEDRDFAVAVVDDGVLGERTLFTDGFRAAGTGRDYRYMRTLGHLPLLLHPAPRDVAVLALGTGTTLGAVGLHPEARIDVLEISSAVVTMASHFEQQNRTLLAPSSRERVRVVLGDGRASLAGAAARYDVLTMEPLLPDSPFAVYLYTREFYAIAQRALKPGGIVCQWVPPHALSGPTFRAVLGAFASAFPWSGVFVFGTQVILIGAAAVPELDPARFHALGETASSLASELSELGLSSVADVCARFACSGVRFRDLGRALTDADPWIAFVAREEGVSRLADLPRNLGALRVVSEAPPASWLASADRTAAAVSLGARVRAAREAHAWSEVLLRAPAIASSDEEAIRATAHALDALPALARESVDSRELSDEIEFLASLRRGVSELAADGSQTSARVARAPLERALALRPERGDARLYLAVALQRDGDPRAETLLRELAERSPGIARTPEGLRARSLGLLEGSWRALALRGSRPRKRSPRRIRDGRAFRLDRARKGYVSAWALPVRRA
ncbi:MAG: spermidine synthase [Planctomycetota bacterium]